MFELSQLLAYRRGQYDPTQHLEKVTSMHCKFVSRSFCLLSNLMFPSNCVHLSRYALNVSSYIALSSLYNREFTRHWFHLISALKRLLCHIVLLQIPDSGIRKMILHMIQLDPESRLSAESHLQEYVGVVFPNYFSPFLHKFYSLLNPLSSDARVRKLGTFFFPFCLVILI